MKKTTEKFLVPPTLLCDFYKVGHKDLYPNGTERIYSTLTPRSNKYFPIANKVVVFGIQGFVKKYLINYFNEYFFSRPKADVIAEYVRIIKYALGVENPDASHIAELHDLGYLPIRLKALKEGTLSPVKVPVLTIENTHNNFFWLTNYLETLISTEVWLPITSATTAYQYRKILNEYAMKTVGNTDGVEFQAHDFSMRGMSSLESAMSSGAGHLLSSYGTDSIPSISYLENYYNADVEKEIVGVSIVATEHSIMSSLTLADGERDEYDAYKHLLNRVPSGFLSIVSDTYDFWKVIGETLPRLKNEIMNRDGRIVIRPDSGTPEDIICGSPNAETELERKGLIEALWDIFGGIITDKGYKLLDPHIGAIYGDSITLERAETIMSRLEAKGFASTNIVLGIGSYTYQYVTRDTWGQAIKATWTQVNGEEKLLFKDPKTDDGTKRSQRGRVFVTKTTGANIVFQDGLTKESEAKLEKSFVNLLETVFEDGELKRDQSLAEIRQILHG